MKQFIQFVIMLFVGLCACTEKMVETTGSIFGTVQDANTGKPLENCSVLLNPLGLTTTTGSDGSFHFAHIEGGEYSIQTSKVGYATNSKSITVTPGDESRADFLLYEAISTMGTLYGTVTDASTHAPLSGCNVLLQPTGKAVTTGSDGSYIFQNLTTGEYSISVTKRNYYNDNRNGITIQAGKTTQVDVLLEEFNANEQLPELGAIKTSNIMSFSVHVESSVLDQGSTSVTERGFIYGLSPNLTIDNGVKVVARAGDNSRFYADISGLQTLTKYYIVSYAMNTLGVAYSSVESFTTLSNNDIPAPQNVIYVTTSGNDNNDGTSWQQAKQTITAAMEIADPGMEIWVSIGAYNERVSPKDGISVYGGFSGIEKSLNERRPNSRTSISGITCDVYTQKTIIDGFKIANRSSTSYVVRLRDYIYMRNCEISNNHYFIISVSTRQYSCVIENCIIRNNATSGLGGEGIIHVAYGGYVTLVNCFLQGNKAGNVIWSDSYVETRNCVITNNDYGIRVASGGGTFINTTLASNDHYAIGAQSDIQLYNCIIWNNSIEENFQGSEGSITQEGCQYVTNADNSSIRFIAPCSSVGSSNWTEADWALSAGSSCIDKGFNVFYPINEDPYDIAGNPRISNSVIDIGAYEY